MFGVDVANANQSTRARRFFLRATGIAALTIITCGSVLLVFSGTVKLSDLTEFREVVASHHVFASSAINVLAPLVAVLEVLAGIVCIWMLAVHKRASLAGLVLASTFLLFAAYAAWLVFHPPPAPTSCGCVGAGSVVEPRAVPVHP
jgi:hypothetical protein